MAQSGSLSLGDGCAATASGKVPTLMIPPPVAGECLEAKLTNADPNSTIYIFASGATSNVTRIGACPVYLDLSMFAPVARGTADANGNFTAKICVPKAARGLTIHAQGLTWAPKGDGLTNGLELAVGDCAKSTAITSNFNGTKIDKGNTVWFNAVGKAGDLKSECKLRFSNVKIEFTSGGKAMSIDAPSSVICFEGTAKSASTVYDAKRDEWKTVLPKGYTGNFFLSGAALPLPDGLPGGIKDVRWSGILSSCTGDTNIKWKWAAAAYTNFPSDLGKICVKPIDGSASNPYDNSHHAGTPECSTKFVTGGARGGGGSNFTGSYSGTGSVDC